MKIAKIFIRDFDQFQDVVLDFTDPITGEALDKICFMGSNGTGKSKILELIRWSFKDLIPNIYFQNDFLSENPYPRGKILFTFESISNYVALFVDNGKVKIFKIEKQNAQFKSILSQIWSVNVNPLDADFLKEYVQGTLSNSFLDTISFRDGKDILVFSPSESNTDFFDFSPDTTLNDANRLFKLFPYYSEVSNNTVKSLWNVLMYNNRKRAENQDNFEHLPENLSKTKKELLDLYSAQNPEILKDLGEIWNKILNRAGLFFDYLHARIPYQLTDSLEANVRLKNSGNSIFYSSLSTGIRNYIFRLGHIFALYFNRNIEKGLILIDEPENGLYPDFLFDLVETYEQVTKNSIGQNNTQMFFATHNPIIAAQFKPEERVILEWNDNGSVRTSRGVTPEGDDPNDILKQDFAVHTLMGKKGIEQWEKYIDLKSKLKPELPIDKKMELASEINKIGQLYNFEA